MSLIEKTIFYVKAKKMLDDFVASGGSIDDLTTKDKEYIYIKNTRVRGDDGRLLTLEEKFEILKHPRKKKYVSDVRQALIDEIEKFLAEGKSFHISRKKLPFYERLATYSTYLERKGEFKTHEQIMKYDLGYLNFSDDYFRCLDLKKLNEYEDENGFIDDYRLNEELHAKVKDIAITYGIPYYFVICLLCDKKVSLYRISLDKVRYTEKLLQNHAKRYGSFVGIKRSHPKVYNAFEYLTRYYSDGTDVRFTKQEWLEIFGVGDIENKFSDTPAKEIDIMDAINNIKRQCMDGVVVAKDIEHKDYSKVVKKAFQMGVSVSEVFKIYGLKHKHLNTKRMSMVEMKEIPYLQEMKMRRDELIKISKKTKENGSCEEEIFEAKLQAVIQVYSEFEEKLSNYVPEETDLLQETINSDDLL